MSDAGPQVFGGRYEIVRRIARGGMADVFLARDTSLDRLVALKVLFPEFATDPAFVERFRREAQSAANLSHPNIVSVFDWGQEERTYFIVMEYVEGRSLAQIVREQGPLDPNRAADLTADIALALDFAHRRGVVHRDVKPGNVLVSPSGQVKVTDFGIARAVTTQENLTRTGTVMGTATYFSPEQARGDAVDARSDVYALGVVLYEMLTGRPPFSAESPVSVAYKHVQETPEPVRARNPDVPPELEAITLKALTKDPEHRYATAEDLHADLRRFREGRPVVATAAGAGLATAATAAVPGATTVNPAVGGYEATRSVSTTAERYEEAEREPPRRSAAFVVVLIVLLALLAVLLFLFARNLGFGTSVEQVEVPKVTELPQEEAERILREAGFEVRPQAQENLEVEEGIVFGQDPAPGTRADEGSVVTILVSSGEPPVAVPDVVGDHVDDARAELENLGLTVDVVEEPSEEEPAGIVLAQDPPPGEEVPVESTVRLTVSSGPPEVEVPDVSGRTPDEAANILGRAGFKTTRTEEASDSVEAGRVIGTQPPAGSTLPKGDTVVIVVSTGPATATVPSVVGLTQAEAERRLRDAGFEVQVTTQPTTDPSQDGRVVDQSPPGGTEAREGSRVTIFVGQLTGPTTTTTSSTTTTTTGT